MSRYVEFALEDGTRIVMQADEPGGLVKSSIGDVTRRAGESLEEGLDNARKAAMVVIDKMRGMAPDELEVTFGLGVSAELGTLIIAQAQVNANYTIRMTWKKAPA